MHRLTKICSLIAPVVLSLSVTAQDSIFDSLVFEKARKNTIDQYHSFIGNLAGLHNGPQYLDYMHTISEGIPYFRTTEPMTGSVTYNGILYENAPLLYDVLKEKLITTSPGSALRQELIGERVSSFSVPDHKFVKSPAFLNNQKITGFLEVLFEGKNNSLYKKHSKKAIEDLTQNRVMMKVSDVFSYYIERDNKLYEVTNKKSILQAYANHRHDINGYLRKTKFRQRNKNDAELKKLAAFYDTL